MCGIAGILHRDGRPIDRSALGRMAEAIVHRGPDGKGFHVDAAVPSVGLASRRLAIIDIAGGHQPIDTADGRYTIVYNGEIFNTDDVRRELLAHGTVFRTHCDTEVVLEGYARWGPGVLSKLNGMWAFAIWDRDSRQLFLARDRLGVKPLVYADVAGSLVFASEIKSLLASGLVERTVDLAPLPHYLSTFVVPDPMTLFRGVRRLLPGQYLMANSSGLREVTYWDCSFPEDEKDLGLEHYCDEVQGLVEDSVRRRLVSDVPLGVFLSGGVDSALVATVAARALQEPLRTFTMGFRGSATDERPAAWRVAVALRATHSESEVLSGEAARALPNLLEAHDEPSESLVQGYFVSRAARRAVTVVLTGVGGDELFSSYPTHRVVDFFARLDALPPAIRSAVLALARALPGRRSRRLTALAEMKPDARVTGTLLHQTDRETRASLLDPGLREVLDLEGPQRVLEEHYARAQARHPLNRLLYVYAKTYLPNELLRTLDTMSMLNSLEARVPLLDYRLVERAMQIPARHKMSPFRGKVILREIAKRILPAGLLTAGKRGFTLPLDEWLRGEFVEALRDVLSEPATRRRGVFDPSAVSKLLNSYLDGNGRLLSPVMMIFAFEQWARRALDPPPAPAESAPRLDFSSPEVSVIIVNWNTREILRNCLDSLGKHLGTIRHETLVVDNASSDGSADMVAAEFPAARLIRNEENVGFGRANNQAMQVARGSWLLLLNSDTLLTDDSVAALIRHVAAEPGLGVAHCRLVMKNGQLQHSTYRFPSLSLALLEETGLYKLLPRSWRGRVLLAGYWNQGEERDVDWVSGAFMLLRREVFDTTQGFSKDYFMYGEDMEWCYRIRDAGFRIRYYPQASIVHLDHSSSAMRWGDRRIAICIERQLENYQKRNGRGLGALFHLVKTGGALFRVTYFGARSAFGGSHQAYHRDMKRYQWLSFRTHLGLLRNVFRA